MNKLLLPILTATLLPFASAQAAPGKTYGGFAPKTRFILVVVERESIQTKGTTTKQNARVPEGTPDYAIGDNVKFKIGKKGALQLDEERIQFQEGTETVNYYSNAAAAAGQKGDEATVRKSAKGEAKKAKVIFYTYKMDGLELVTNRVTYSFAK